MTIAVDGEGRYADVLIHEAAHAVVAWELGARIGQLTIDGVRGSGEVTFVSDATIGRFARGSIAHRSAAERDMLIFHAGFVAQRRFNYDGTTWVSPSHDYAAVFRIAQEFSSDTALVDAWSTYLEDRARQMIERPATWTRIQALALELARRAAPDGTTILDGETAEQFMAALRVRTTSAIRAYRRREASGVLVVLDDELTRKRFVRAVARALPRCSA